MPTYKLKSRDAVFSFLIITRSRGAAPISWPATPLNRRHSWCGPFIPAKDLFVSLNVLIGEEFTTSWTHSKRLAYQVTPSSDQILRKPSFKHCFQLPFSVRRIDISKSPKNKQSPSGATQLNTRILLFRNITYVVPPI